MLLAPAFALSFTSLSPPIAPSTRTPTAAMVVKDPFPNKMIGLAPSGWPHKNDAVTLGGFVLTEIESASEPAKSVPWPLAEVDSMPNVIGLAPKAWPSHTDDATLATFLDTELDVSPSAPTVAASSAAAASCCACASACICCLRSICVSRSIS